MPKKFVNPLLQSSTQPTIETETMPDTKIEMEKPLVPEVETKMDAPLVPSTSTITYTYSEEELEALVRRRKQGKNAFDKTHERLSVWMLKSVKKKFKKLAQDLSVSHVELMEEAMNDLFKKYGR